MKGSLHSFSDIPADFGKEKGPEKHHEPAKPGPVPRRDDSSGDSAGRLEVQRLGTVLREKQAALAKLSREIKSLQP